MKEKKIPTREQLKEYRQLISSLDDCGKNLPELIDKIDAFSEEFDVFTKEYVEDGKCGVKDAAGDILVPALFDHVGCFFVDWARDRAVPVTKSGKMALAAHDGKGTLLTDFAYDDIVFNDYYYLYKDGKKGIATPQGRIVIPAVMDKVDIPVKDIVTFIKNRKQGFAVISKGLIFGPEFDSCDLSEYGVEYITLNFELKF